MKQDKDLAFLATCKNEDLRTLCDILTYNKKGELRLSEQLTNSDAYIHCYPERMNMMTKEISEEIRKYGSNTVKTLYRRGEADSYDTILRRVCKRMSVVVGYDDSVQELEHQLLTNVCEEAASHLSDEELRNLADEAGIPHKNLKRQMLTYSIMMAIRHNTYLFAQLVNYVTLRIAHLLLGRGVLMVGMNTFGRYVGMATGPIGWALLAGWTISDIASPAYRVMIPAVIMIASMRFRQTVQLTQKI
jgi:uncharacterized protein YaaW (UPF0174 family)